MRAPDTLGAALALALAGAAAALLPARAAAQAWSFDAGTEPSRVSLGARDETWWSNRLQASYRAGPDLGWHVGAESQHRKRGDDVTLSAGAYRRMPGEDATGGRHYAEVKRMMVEPSLRGRGIGMALLGQLESRMLGEGLELALLETGAAQAQAVGLYQRSGYRRRAAFTGYPDNGLSLFLEKRLAR